MPPDVHSTFLIGLIERLPDRGSDALWAVGVALEV